jgi:hypothetical protein
MLVMIMEIKRCICNLEDGVYFIIQDFKHTVVFVFEFYPNLYSRILEGHSSVTYRMRNDYIEWPFCTLP